MEISQALQNAQSIEKVVEIINEGGTSFYDGNEIAAQYAYQGADEAGYGITKENIEGHLDILAEAGAEFDYAEAVAVAVEAVSE